MSAEQIAAIAGVIAALAVLVTAFRTRHHMNVVHTDIRAVRETVERLNARRVIDLVDQVAEAVETESLRPPDHPTKEERGPDQDTDTQ